MLVPPQVTEKFRSIALKQVFVQEKKEGEVVFEVDTELFHVLVCVWMKSLVHICLE
jgi:hypothetical protein